MIAAPPKAEYFRTEKLSGLPDGARVDAAKRTIFGAKALEVGPLNAGDSRPWKVDEITLEQLQRLATAKNGGTKMRFAHPNMSNDGMGRHIGRAVNARIVRDNGPAYVAIDATLNAKGGQRTQDMVSHVLDLADNAPEDFGLSIAPILDREAMNKITPDENGLVPIRLKALQAIDFVDDPAATRGGLFDLHSEELQDLPAQATNLLDTFFHSSPAEVIRQRFGEFLDIYLKNRGADMADQPNAGAESEKKIADLSTELSSVKAELAALKSQKPAESPATPAAPNPEEAKQAKAKADLARVAEINALAKLAKVDDATKQLMIDAGFSRAEAQDWLKSSGHLSAKNPPISEGEGDLGSKPETPEDKFGKEFDAAKDVFSQQGVTRESYIKSRLKDAA